VERMTGMLKTEVKRKPVDTSPQLCLSLSLIRPHASCMDVEISPETIARIPTSTADPPRSSRKMERKAQMPLSVP